jgi:hypothetical protein
MICLYQACCSTAYIIACKDQQENSQIIDKLWYKVALNTIKQTNHEKS